MPQHIMCITTLPSLSVFLRVQDTKVTGTEFDGESWRRSAWHISLEENKRARARTLYRDGGAWKCSHDHVVEIEIDLQVGRAGATLPTSSSQTVHAQFMLVLVSIITLI